MTAVWMTAAVVTQWASITALRASAGRRPVLFVASLLAMVASMASVSVALSHGLSIAVAYGIWTGLGVALAALTGLLGFGDRLDPWQTAGLVLVLAGVVGLQL